MQKSEAKFDNNIKTTFYILDKNLRSLTHTFVFFGSSFVQSQEITAFKCDTFSFITRSQNRSCP